MKNISAVRMRHMRLQRVRTSVSRLRDAACRCNGSGSCKNCSCRKANSSCSNCLPLRRGHCTNTDQQLPRPSTDNAPASRQALPSSLHTPDNEGIEPPAIAPPETGEAPQRAEAGPSLTTDSAAKNVTPSNVTPSRSATANDSTIADLLPPISEGLTWMAKRSLTLLIAATRRLCIGDGTFLRFHLEKPAKRLFESSDACFKPTQMVLPLKV